MKLHDIMKSEKAREGLCGLGGLAVGLGIGYGARGALEGFLTRLKGILKREKNPKKVDIPEEHLEHIPPHLADEETVQKVVDLFDYEKEKLDDKEKYNDIIAKTDYNGIDYDLTLEDDELDPIDDNDAISEKPDDYDPYPISADEYGREEGFDQVEAHFYDGDETFTDEKDEKMDEWRDIVGFDAADNFAINPDVNNFFVRNERLKQDIEIIRVKGRFDES